MIVVDANVLASLVLPLPWTAAAESLLQQDADWEAPILWRSELRSIVAAVMRRGDLTFEQARAALAEAESQMLGHEHDVDSRRVLELARDSDCSPYDCEFIALAMQLGTVMVTTDRRLLRAFPRHTQELPSS